MALGLTLWVCCLPVVLLVVWFLGLGRQGALIGAGATLALMLIACWWICASRARINTGRGGSARGENERGNHLLDRPTHGGTWRRAGALQGEERGG